MPSNGPNATQKALTSASGGSLPLCLPLTELPLRRTLPEPGNLISEAQVAASTSLRRSTRWSGLNGFLM